MVIQSNQTGSWDLQGCSFCLEAALLGLKGMQVIGVVLAQQVTVYQCGKCKSLWEETDREAHVITSERAVSYGLRV